MKYNWEVRRVSFEKLEKALEEASREGWDVFSIMSVEGEFVIVVRRSV